MLIRDAFPSDEPAWRQLWDGYVAFYEADVPEDVTAKTWERLIRKQDGLFCRIAETGGEVCGFSLSVLHAGTWTTAPESGLLALAGLLAAAVLSTLLARPRVAAPSATSPAEALVAE